MAPSQQRLQCSCSVVQPDLAAPHPFHPLTLVSAWQPTDLHVSVLAGATRKGRRMRAIATCIKPQQQSSSWPQVSLTAYGDGRREGQR
jgi:hypothetical protein